MQVILTRCAANLKRLRFAGDLSLSELARRSGVAKGTLSRLEAGTGNPTVETLWSLADALGVPLTELIAEHTDEAFVVRNDENPEMTGRNATGRYLDRVFGGGTPLDILEGSFPPGRVRAMSGYPPGTISRFFVMEGMLRLVLPQETIELGRWDFIRFKSDVPYTLLALGDTPARVLGVYSLGPPTLMDGDADPIRASFTI